MSTSARDVGFKVSLKKAFRFSCSYTAGHKTIGRNYVLWISLDGLDEEDEKIFTRRVDESLIQRFHNRDLSEAVELFREAPITDAILLEACHHILSKETPEYRIRSYELERDGSTRTIYADQ